MIWTRVAATVRPTPGRTPPTLPNLPPQALADVKPAPKVETAAKGPGPVSKPKTPRLASPETKAIEPGRLRRLIREREEGGPRLDLHGLTQDAARARLIGFIRQAHADGWRAVMVITGKGSRGDGVLRRYTPEWLASPELRDMVAGVAEAHRRHGGEGALYVALKRRAPLG